MDGWMTLILAGEFFPLANEQTDGRTDGRTGLLLFFRAEEEEEKRKIQNFADDDVMCECVFLSCTMMTRAGKTNFASSSFPRDLSNSSIDRSLDLKLYFTDTSVVHNRLLVYIPHSREWNWEWVAAADNPSNANYPSFSALIFRSLFRSFNPELHSYDQWYLEKNQPPESLPGWLFVSCLRKIFTFVLSSLRVDLGYDILPPAKFYTYYSWSRFSIQLLHVAFAKRLITAYIIIGELFSAVRRSQVKTADRHKQQKWEQEKR